MILVLYKLGIVQVNLNCILYNYIFQPLSSIFIEISYNDQQIINGLYNNPF